VTGRQRAAFALVLAVALCAAGGSAVLVGTSRGRSAARYALHHAAQLLAGSPAAQLRVAQAAREGSEGLGHAVVAGARTWRWVPDHPLPVLSPGRPALVVVSPHPDDETLSMGVLIADAERSGTRVILVEMTDGGSSGAYPEVLHRWRAWPGSSSRPPLTRQDLARARLAEMAAASRRVGVAPGDVVLAHTDAPGSDDGARTTVAEARAVLGTLAAAYPDATFVTMSYTAERQLDHLDDGVALRELADSGAVRHAEWVVSRLWWQLPTPAWAWQLPADPEVAARVRAAAAEYARWDPAHLRLAVGETSVADQFAQLEADPRDRVHL
jgi:LmbE family N-acetylglucosaminyl deacetylase